MDFEFGAGSGIWSDDSEFSNWELYHPASPSDHLDTKPIKTESNMDEFSTLDFELEDPGPSSWVNEEFGETEKSGECHKDNSGASEWDRIKTLEENIQTEADDIERLQHMGHFSPKSANPQDEKEMKKILIQRHLIVLLHAQQNQSHPPFPPPNDDSIECPFALCRIAKYLMRNCHHGHNCTETHCYSSHLIVSHWNSCTTDDCLICSPLRQQLSLDLQPDPTPASASVFVKIEPSEVSLKFKPTPPPSPEFDETGEGSESERKPSISDHSYALKKEWQASVSGDMRSHLVNKIVQAICPEFEPPLRKNSDGDELTLKLMAYAVAMEERMHGVANSRMEYYNLISDRIYWIQTERLHVRDQILHECSQLEKEIEEREF